MLYFHFYLCHFFYQAINRAGILNQHVESLKAKITEKFNTKTLNPKEAIHEITALSDVSFVQLN